MGNKIIMNEEVLANLDAEILKLEEELKHHKEYKDTIGSIQTTCTLFGFEKSKQLILENSSIISIDESIEDRAKKYAGIKADVTVDEEERYYNANTQHYDSFIAGATEQSLISEIKSKETKIPLKKLQEIKQLIRHTLLSGPKLPIIDLIDDLEKDLNSISKNEFVVLQERHKKVIETKNILVSVYTNASGYLWHMMMVDSGTDLGWSDHTGDCEMSGAFTSYEKALENALNLIDKADLDNFEKECPKNKFHWGNYAQWLIDKK